MVALALGSEPRCILLIPPLTRKLALISLGAQKHERSSVKP